MTPAFLPYKFIIEVILTVATSLCILALLIFSKPLKLSTHPEDKMFRRLCWTLFIYAIASILQSYQIFMYVIPFYMLSAHIVRYLPDFILLFLCMQWLIFVDLAVTHSPDRIKRRYRFVWVPLAVMVVMLAIGYGLLQNVYTGMLATGEVPAQAAADYRLWSWINYGVAMLIFIGYLLTAFRLVHYHYTEKKQPLFLRLDVFIILWIIAFVVQSIPGVFLVIDVPCAGISLLLTYLSMRNRYKYMDYDTDLYNEEFLEFFEDYAKKNNYSGGCAIAFESSGDARLFAKTLMQYRPEKSIAIRMKDGRYFVLANLNNTSAVKCFIELIKDATAAIDPGINIRSEYWFQYKNEASDTFAKRVLQAPA